MTDNLLRYCWYENTLQLQRPHCPVHTHRGSGSLLICKILWKTLVRGKIKAGLCHVSLTVRCHWTHIVSSSFILHTIKAIGSVCSRFFALWRPWESPPPSSTTRKRRKKFKSLPNQPKRARIYCAQTFAQAGIFTNSQMCCGESREQNLFFQIKAHSRITVTETCTTWVKVYQSIAQHHLTCPWHGKRSFT